MQTSLLPCKSYAKQNQPRQLSANSATSSPALAKQKTAAKPLQLFAPQPNTATSQSVIWSLKQTILQQHPELAGRKELSKTEIRQLKTEFPAFKNLHPGELMGGAPAYNVQNLNFYLSGIHIVYNGEACAQTAGNSYADDPAGHLPAYLFPLVADGLGCGVITLPNGNLLTYSGRWSHGQPCETEGNGSITYLGEEIYHGNVYQATIQAVLTNLNFSAED